MSLNHHSIRWFIALSVVIHAAALYQWRPPAFEPGATGRVLHIAMTDIAGEPSAPAMPGPAGDSPRSGAETPAGHVNRRPANTPAHAPEMLPRQATETSGVQQADAADETPSQETAPDMPASGSTEPDLRESERHLRTSVLKLVTQRLKYPAIARRKGWQGVVTLQLHIESDGLISMLHVNQTSGYPVLDRAAVKSLQLAQVPHAAQWLNGRAIDIVVPVEYRLIGS